MSGATTPDPSDGGRFASDLTLLDNPTWHALATRQGRFGRRTTRAARFVPEVAIFGAVSDADDPRAWDELAELTGAGQLVSVTGSDPRPPAGWRVHRRVDGVQMVADPTRFVAPSGRRGGRAGPSPSVEVGEHGGEGGGELVPLGRADVADLLELVGVAQPGPFGSRTVELGGYVGVRRGGRLVAMAGRRLQLPGLCEISAVATHPDVRGQGLGRRVVTAVATAVVAEGDVPFLHASASNVVAIGLYESLGFTVRKQVAFVVVEPPARRDA
ncbi:MAG: GNAT family N-acetyltransferase [Actinomycetota bacterium]|nr:GNAT family N-acetyltransferase [Actinomycetota bacterium]